MIKLNKNLYIGQKVTIPSDLSYQVLEAGVGGEYVISKFYEERVILQRISDGSLLETTHWELYYLTGTKVKDKELWMAIDSGDCQPERSDRFYKDYFTENGDEFGYWYCGWCDSHRTLVSSMVDSRWCYGRLPWYE